MPIIDTQGGWSVVYREDYANDQLPWFQMGQSLNQNEAVALARLIFDRDKKGHVEIRDRDRTARGYFTPSRPEGFFEF
jgi:hypothetical protein